MPSFRILPLTDPARTTARETAKLTALDQDIERFITTLEEIRHCREYLGLSASAEDDDGPISCLRRKAMV